LTFTFFLVSKVCESTELKKTKLFFTISRTNFEQQIESLWLRGLGYEKSNKIFFFFDFDYFWFKNVALGQIFANPKAKTFIGLGLVSSIKLQ